MGRGVQSEDASETVGFDTNLDGGFTDTIRTVAGADAFSPGFCGGLAVNATAAGGCTDDSDGVDFGGRIGYDWQAGRVVFGVLADVSKTDVIDSVTAFSSTPAFYSFTREVNHIAGLRGRVGVGNGRMLVYGTGGGAWAKLDQRFTTSNIVNRFVPSNGDSDDDDEDGLSEKVWGEYLFTRLNDREESAIRVQGPAPATNPFILVNAGGTDLQRTDRFEFRILRAGLNFRF